MSNSSHGGGGGSAHGELTSVRAVSIADDMNPSFRKTVSCQNIERTPINSLFTCALH